MAFFQTQDGCSLYYELIGEAANRPTVVFLNGTMQTTIYWKLIIKGFSGRYRILLYDARSQGASELGELPLTLDLHVSDLLDLMAFLGIGRAHLVGLSHGAYVALALAGRRPDMVKRLVLCSVGAQGTFRARMIVRTWHEILKRHSLDAMVWAAVPHVFGPRYLKQNEKSIDRIVKTVVRRNKRDHLLAHLEAMRGYPPLAKRLSCQTTPVLVLTGQDDPLVTASGAADIARACNGRQMTLAGTGHSIPAEVPDDFIRQVNAFLTT